MSHGGGWTAERVMARLREAAGTLRLVATVSGPGAQVTWWPDVVHGKQGKNTAYGYTAAELPPGRANAGQIDRMDETLQWLRTHLSRHACDVAGLVSDSGWLLWARAIGWSYEKCARGRQAQWGGETRGGGPSLTIPGGNARPSLVKIEMAALWFLAECLNTGQVPVDRDARAEPVAPAPALPQREAPAVRGIRALAPERGPNQHGDGPGKPWRRPAA